jgi:hypothetical protein
VEETLVALTNGGGGGEGGRGEHSDMTGYGPSVMTTMTFQDGVGIVAAELPPTSKTTAAELAVAS